MQRYQFFTLIVLSSLVTILLGTQIVLEHLASGDQNRLALASQAINQGQAFQSNLKQLAIRILQDSQKTGDPGLQDLLKRNQITYTPNPESAPSETPASTTPSTH
jgi:hypothetical protein